MIDNENYVNSSVTEPSYNNENSELNSNIINSVVLTILK